MKYFLLALLLFVPTLTVRADSINYAHAGSLAPETTLLATGSNGIDLFYYGSTAGYTNYVGVFDLSTNFNSGWLFNNKTTAVGSEVIVGAAPGQINAGDPLLFYIDSPDGIFSSQAAFSADGVNHAYVVSYAGGKLNGVQVPAGLLLGMEDQRFGHSDLNYNDENLVVGNVTTSVTPEPSSFALLGTGLFGLSVISLSRRRSRDKVEQRLL